MADGVIAETDFHFPGQQAVYHGKVRDVYTMNDDKIVIVATDRISAFDVILPRQIPFKGQVLNQLAAHFLEATTDIVPNWLEVVPDPNVSLGKRADPVKIELVIRGCLVGHAWREYASGKRQLCGVVMPDGLKEFDPFPVPIITPTTKAAVGHDQDITEAAIIATELATEEEWTKLKEYMQALFARGQKMAREQGLVLADTKYEFGRLEGALILIDEIHTPDSARYFYANGYDAYVTGESSEKPRHLSKEFVREWLMDHDFSGQKGQVMPELDDDFITMVSKRYIELYEEMTDKQFVPDTSAEPLQRAETNVLQALKEIQA